MDEVFKEWDKNSSYDQVLQGWLLGRISGGGESRR
jgi:hypothetical protein